MIKNGPTWQCRVTCDSCGQVKTWPYMDSPNESFRKSIEITGGWRSFEDFDFCPQCVKDAGPQGLLSPLIFGSPLQNDLTAIHLHDAPLVTRKNG
jgi:hypothetical protein